MVRNVLAEGLFYNVCWWASLVVTTWPVFISEVTRASRRPDVTGVRLSSVFRGQRCLLYERTKFSLSFLFLTVFRVHRARRGRDDRGAAAVPRGVHTVGSW